jgi:hypothetical protein
MLINLLNKLVVEFLHSICSEFHLLILFNANEVIYGGSFGQSVAFQCLAHDLFALYFLIGVEHYLLNKARPLMIEIQIGSLLLGFAQGVIWPVPSTIWPTISSLFKPILQHKMILAFHRIEKVLLISLKKASFCGFFSH